MKTTATLLMALLFGLSATALTDGGEKKTYKVDTEKSTIFWTGKKVTGQHTGTLKLKEGEVIIEDGAPALVTFEIDMNTIVNTDLKDEDMNKKLVGHLKSDDFFAVKSHPIGRFTATDFTPITGAKEREANYKVKGRLVLKGISKDIEFDALIAISDNGVVSNGEVVFDRSEYDIRYGSGSFFEDLGDNLIYDDVELNFVFSATR